MAVIPQPKNPVQTAIESKTYPQDNRTYLGMSGVGKKCPRKQWYAWRWVKDIVINARLKRIFERGDLEEPRIIKDLESVGITISDEQLEIRHISGHSLGHIDGIATNVPGAEKTVHLAEFKTMKNSKFNALKKKIELLGFEQALHELHVEYWYQIQAYMGYLELTRCLYVITNKDTEERIYARAHFYKSELQWVKERILNILISNGPPPRISEREDWHECKLCEFKDICFKHESALTNCRTCKYAEPMDDGVWLCAHPEEKIPLTKDSQKKGCKHHCYIKGL